MIPSRRRFEEFAWVFGFHGAAVRTYRMFGKRGPTSSGDPYSLRKFYGKLLPHNALAFDIGANGGLYSEELEAAGCRVVAVEPNGDCLRHLELTCRKRRVEAIHAAVGPRNGLATFNISDVHDDASMISDGDIPHDQHIVWNRTVAVPVLTLDCLISHYGMPDYIKLDVEGYEPYVLDGLSKQPSLLSFEFHYLYAERAMLCLDKPVLAENSEFNFTDESGARFELSRWVDRESIKAIARGFSHEKIVRDIYVRTSRLDVGIRE